MSVGTEPLRLGWADVREQAARLAHRWPPRGVGLRGVYGVPSGGAPVAVDVADRLGLPVVDEPGKRVLVVDDLVDSGTTLMRYVEGGAGLVDALYRKPWSPPGLAADACEVDAWLVFPWEHDPSPTDAVTRLLSFIGEDPRRDGLVDTPARVCRALKEMTAGYAVDPVQLLATSFEADYDEMVVVRGVPFTSLCEHHLLPFTGVATVAYIPTDRVCGLSKLARLVECFARRLQLQERMTTEIADTLEGALAPQGVGVLVKATHSCMSCRGVNRTGEMVTSALRGAMLSTPQARAEFLSLAHA